MPMTVFKRLLLLWILAVSVGEFYFVHCLVFMTVTDFDLRLDNFIKTDTLHESAKCNFPESGAV